MQVHFGGIMSSVKRTGRAAATVFLLATAGCGMERVPAKLARAEAPAAFEADQAPASASSPVSTELPAELRVPIQRIPVPTAGDAHSRRTAPKIEALRQHMLDIEN